MSDGLNPDQLDAVVHLEGPLLVVAGAAPARPACSPIASPT